MGTLLQEISTTLTRVLLREGSRGRVFHFLQGTRASNCPALAFVGPQRRFLRGSLYPQHSGRRIVRRNVVPPLAAKRRAARAAARTGYAGLTAGAEHLNYKAVDRLSS